MTREECAALLAIASANYGREVSMDQLDVWEGLLVDVEPELGARALREHITESPHFPRISDIRQRIASARLGTVCDPGAAWGEVRRGISNCGSYRCPSWSHPAIEDAVDALGWRDICMSRTDDLPTLRAQFERYYRAAFNRYTRAANVGALEAALAARGSMLGAPTGQLVAAPCPEELLSDHDDDEPFGDEPLAAEGAR